MKRCGLCAGTGLVGTCPTCHLAYASSDLVKADQGGEALACPMLTCDRTQPITLLQCAVCKGFGKTR